MVEMAGRFSTIDAHPRCHILELRRAVPGPGTSTMAVGHTAPTFGDSEDGEALAKAWNPGGVRGPGGRSVQGAPDPAKIALHRIGSELVFPEPRGEFDHVLCRVLTEASLARPALSAILRCGSPVPTAGAAGSADAAVRYDAGEKMRGAAVWLPFYVCRASWSVYCL